MDVKSITKEISQKGEIRGSWKLKHLIALFTDLAKADKRSEKLRKRFAILSWVSVGIIGVTGIISLNAETTLPFILAVAVLIIPLILFIWGWLAAKKTDFENEFRLFALPLLRELSEDVAPGSKVAVVMPTTPIENKANLKETSDKYAKGVYYKCVDYIYSRPFIEATVPLRDGNILKIVGQAFVKKTKKTKRNARGKIKTKYKYKRWAMLNLELLVNPDRYICDQMAFKAAPRLKEKCAVRRKGGQEILRLKYLDKIDGSLPNPSPSPDLAVKEILGLYQMLRGRA